jgi:hypothetical protein
MKSTDEVFFDKFGLARLTPGPYPWKLETGTLSPDVDDN